MERLAERLSSERPQSVALDRRCMERPRLERPAERLPSERLFERRTAERPSTRQRKTTGSGSTAGFRATERPTDRPTAALGRTCSLVNQCRFGGSLGLLGSLGSMGSLMGSEGSYILTVAGFLLYLSDVLGDLTLTLTLTLTGLTFVTSSHDYGLTCPGTMCPWTSDRGNPGYCYCVCACGHHHLWNRHDGDVSRDGDRA